MTNSFASSHDKHMQIYFFCIKRQANNDFLKEVESTALRKHSYVFLNPLNPTFI